MLRENPNVKSGVEGIAPNCVGRPEDLTAATGFLASDDARFMKAAALIVGSGASTACDAVAEGAGGRPHP